MRTRESLEREAPVAHRHSERREYPHGVVVQAQRLERAPNGIEEIPGIRQDLGPASGRQRFEALRMGGLPEGKEFALHFGLPPLPLGLTVGVPNRAKT